MPTPPSSTNYKVGGAKMIVGGIDFGNVVSLEIDPTDLELLEHFTSRSGARKMDKRVVVQKSLLLRVGLDEHAMEIYREYFMASNAGLVVYPLQNPLIERNITLEYRDESGVIWSFSHTKCVVRPSGSMDFGEFDDWVGFEVEVALLEDASVAPRTFGQFTFTA